MNKLDSLYYIVIFYSTLNLLDYIQRLQGSGWYTIALHTWRKQIHIYDFYKSAGTKFITFDDLKEYLSGAMFEKALSSLHLLHPKRQSVRDFRVHSTHL